jgi:hypothetical protein
MPSKVIAYRTAIALDSGRANLTSLILRRDITITTTDPESIS